MALYIIPCLLGGRLIRRCRASGAVFWGIGLGACYFGVILAISLGMSGGKLDMNSVGIAIPLMCVLSSVTGTIRLKKRQTLGNQNQFRKKSFAYSRCCAIIAKIDGFSVIQTKERFL